MAEKRTLLKGLKGLQIWPWDLNGSKLISTYPYMTASAIRESPPADKELSYVQINCLARSAELQKRSKQIWSGKCWESFVSLYSVTLKICSCSFSFSDKNLPKKTQKTKNQSNDAQTQTDWQICMHTLGVKIHQINVPGLMSKIQLHWFKLLESGQSWKGIKAESMLAFLYQKSLIWQPCHFF